MTHLHKRFSNRTTFYINIFEYKRNVSSLRYIQRTVGQFRMQSWAIKRKERKEKKRKVLNETPQKSTQQLSLCPGLR